MAHLYELTIEREALLKAIEQQGGELSDEQMEALLSNDEDIDTKVSNNIKLYDELDLIYKACDDEVKRLNAKKKALKGKMVWLKGYTLSNLQHQNKLSAGTDTHKASRLPGRLKVDDLPEGIEQEALDKWRVAGFASAVVEYTLCKKDVLQAAKDDPDYAEKIVDLEPGQTLDFAGGLTIRRGDESLRLN